MDDEDLIEEKEDEIIAGIVFDPICDELFSAGQGRHGDEHSEESIMTKGTKKNRASVAMSGAVYDSALDRRGQLASFIANPAEAKRTGALPLAPPSRSASFA